MSATRDLIAAALTVAGAVRWQHPELSDELRELCARAMADVPEIHFGNMLDCRTCAHFTADGCHSTATCIDAQQYKATAPRQYWTSAQQRASDANMQAYQAIADGYTRDAQPVNATEVPMPEPNYDGYDEIDTLRAEIERLRAELETERIRLAACGVIALSNTPESAEKARKMLPEYRSGSCDDVARMVDQQMDLRAEVARLRTESERLSGLYEQAVKGRADMRSALRDARAAAPQPVSAAEVPMPQGYAERPSDYTWSICVESQMRTYGDAREAAGYARGLVDAGKDAERYRWLRDGNDRKESAAMRIALHCYGMEWDAAIDAALRGEVKP